MNFMFFLNRYDFTYSLYLTDSMNNLSDKTGGATIDNFRKMIKFKNFTNIVSYKLSITDFKLIRISL